MQAWNQVKVKNDQSGFFGQAGVVVRVEKRGDEAHAFVQMDTDNTVQAFDVSELDVL